MLILHPIVYFSSNTYFKWRCCRSASAAASASVRSIADNEDVVDSESNDETAKLDVNDIDDSSVWNYYFLI